MAYSLTDAQRADLQADCGVADMTEPPFTVANLNRQFDRAGGDYNLTVVYVIRQMIGIQHKAVVLTFGTDGLAKQKVFDNLLEMLKMWEKIAGVQGGPLTSGTISLGIDATEADLEAWA